MLFGLNVQCDPNAQRKKEDVKCRVDVRKKSEWFVAWEDFDEVWVCGSCGR